MKILAAFLLLIVFPISTHNGFGESMTIKTIPPLQYLDPNVLTYNNEQYGFSLNIPKDWKYVEIPKMHDEAETLLNFYDDSDYPLLDGYVILLRGYGYGQSYSDNQLQNSLFIGISQRCNADTFDTSGFTCSSPKLLNSASVVIDDKKGQQVTYTSIRTYPDGQIVRLTSEVFIMPVGRDALYIYMDSEKDFFEQHRNVIQRFIESLDTSKMVVEPIIQDIQVLSDSYTYFEGGKNRPLILINPSEFTPQWYVDLNKNFALKFNKPWKENWSLSTNDPEEIKLTAIDSPAFILIKTYNDPNFVNEIKRLDIGDLNNILAPKAITTAKILGADQVNAINVSARNDGYIISISFSKYEKTLDKPRNYDQFLIVHDNGKIFEITYSDVDYKMIPETFLNIMINYFYDGDVSKIPIVEKSKPSLYSNSGITYMPPAGWSREDLNTEFTTSSGVKIPVTTTYYRDNYDGSVPSYMVIFQKDLGAVTDLETQKDEQLSGLIDGLKTGLRTNGYELLEITQSEVETLKDHLIMQIEAKIRIPLNSVDYIDANVKEYALAQKTGMTAGIVLYSDPMDFPITKTEFIQSVSSLQIKEEQKGGGCLITTAAFGSEIAPQVQLLREVRDNILFSTGSGTAFMAGFNEFYYAFSPTVADWERQSPLFKEVVKTTITPMLSTISILNYADIHSEQEMLGYGIGIILLNVGMYFVAPAIIVVKIRSKLKSK